jgi:hypothetical protein
MVFSYVHAPYEGRKGSEGLAGMKAFQTGNIHFLRILSFIRGALSGMGVAASLAGNHIPTAQHPVELAFDSFQPKTRHDRYFTRAHWPI